MKIFRRNNGFTLVELMTTISIAVILMAIAIPSFKTMIENQRLVTTASEFYAAVNLTRAEAIKRGARVNMVANDGAKWTSGWTVFIDANDNLLVDAGETIIFTHDATVANITSVNTFTDTSSTYISYTGNGRSRTKASSQQPQAGTVSFTLGDATRRVKINFLGRARICNPVANLSTCSSTVSGN
ncbi:GspH/FimT family pseudopilin [Undibacterium parvum]|uniref:Type II secretion system protein H n=1 Tax=Undibacterium parvum TaxID=401471 RepID=A0A3Q9BQE8_9BURK|nr:GspH/FimT family pseudopilin [Undibacterium parvum]AZP11327.1 prepilin-type N-terminal cleavage/methylation domain-containing protein [Undibacterium parvum]